MPHERYPTPRDDVDFSLYALREEIKLLEKMRMDNKTADFVLAQSEQISYLAQKLDAIASDIHCAVNNRRAAE